MNKFYIICLPLSSSMKKDPAIRNSGKIQDCQHCKCKIAVSDQNKEMQKKHGKNALVLCAPCFMIDAAKKGIDFREIDFINIDNNRTTH